MNIKIIILTYIIAFVLLNENDKKFEYKKFIFILNRVYIKIIKIKTYSMN